MNHKLLTNLKGVYAISDCENLTQAELLKKTEDMLKVGVPIFQYRNKNQNQNNKIELALKLKLLCHKYDTLFIVNDDVPLAKEISADGVHLGQTDEDIEYARKTLGSKIIGISCYNDLNRATSASEAGADYVAFGSVFPSKTKPNAKVASLELIQQAKSMLNIPVVAIGGITPENGKQLINKNIDFIAIISGLYAAADIISATKAYNELFNT